MKKILDTIPTSRGSKQLQKPYIYFELCYQAASLLQLFIMSSLVEYSQIQEPKYCF